MPVENRYKVDPAQVNNNYEFKVGKKLLKQMFPFVEDVIIEDEDGVNDYTLIYLTPIVDINKLIEHLADCEVNQAALDYFTRYNQQVLFPQILFAEDCRQDVVDLVDEMQQALKRIHYSPAIPDELKLPGNRHLSVIDFRVSAK